MTYSQVGTLLCFLLFSLCCRRVFSDGVIKIDRLLFSYGHSASVNITSRFCFTSASHSRLFQNTCNIHRHTNSCTFPLENDRKIDTNTHRLLFWGLQFGSFVLLLNCTTFNLFLFSSSSCFKPPSSKQPSHDCEIVKLLRFSLFIMICAQPLTHRHTLVHATKAMQRNIHQN